MTDERLTALLAERLLGWRAVPDRFLKSGRSWIPRWRFNPFQRLDDAFLLLDSARGVYKLATDPTGNFTAEVQIGSQVGCAAGDAKAKTITLAIARALKVEA
jgi:hypothetical protein